MAGTVLGQTHSHSTTSKIQVGHSDRVVGHFDPGIIYMFQKNHKTDQLPTNKKHC